MKSGYKLPLIFTNISSKNWPTRFSKFDLEIFFPYQNIKIIINLFLSLIFWYHFSTIWKLGNLVGQFSDNIFVKICQFLAQFQKSNAQEIFYILKIKVFRNKNFPASQVIKENNVVYTSNFLQYYIQMLSTSVKNKNKCGIDKKSKKNSSDILRLH